MYKAELRNASRNLHQHHSDFRFTPGPSDQSLIRGLELTHFRKCEMRLVISRWRASVVSRSKPISDTRPIQGSA